MKTLMPILLFAVLASLHGTASAQANKKEAQCKQQAGEAGNPTHDAVYKRCMGQAAPAAKAGAAAPAKRRSEAECRSMAGEPGNPTYEAVLKSCLGK